ncbi:MAG: hypothetical protein H6635_05070 [Anaerolineales bacterium]|nr:hypothetical protein [Anaerolineales bacterium]MCB9144721.1 hypothetical protein [Anaerolineales bacterium]
MFNPIEYLIQNISWYEPIYNIAWVLFMTYVLILPPLAVFAFQKIAWLRSLLPPRSWEQHRRTYPHLIGAAMVIFSFRLVPYWIFNDKILHFLGGGIAIALVYEYFILNLNIREGNGMISLRAFTENRFSYLVANLFLLMFFSSFFSVFSELYEFASKYLAGYQFDSSGFDTWMDIMANMAGAFLGYLLIWLRKYAIKKTQA